MFCIEFQTQNFDCAEFYCATGFHLSGKTACTVHGTDQLGIVCHAVGQGSAVHAAHIAACIAAVEHIVKLTASGNDIVAVDVVGKFCIQLSLRIYFSGLRQFVSVAAVYADILDPAVPCLHVQPRQRTIHGCVGLYRVNDTQCAENVIDFYQTAQHL